MSGYFDLLNMYGSQSGAGEYQFNSPVTSGSYPMANTGDAASVPLGFWDTGKQAFNDVNWLDKTDPSTGVKTQGAMGSIIGAGSALMNGYLGMKQYGLAKDTLKHNKEMFAKNFDAQKRTTNASLEDRQRARLAGNGGSGYESVGSYMDKNGIR